MTTLHLTAKSGHTARLEFQLGAEDADQRAMVAVVDELEHGRLPHARFDDFRPFVGKKLRYLRRVADTTYYEET